MLGTKNQHVVFAMASADRMIALGQERFGDDFRVRVVVGRRKLADGSWEERAIAMFWIGSGARDSLDWDEPPPRDERTGMQPLGFDAWVAFAALKEWPIPADVADSSRALEIDHAANLAVFLDSLEAGGEAPLGAGSGIA